jgi:hypothetical protein
MASQTDGMRKPVSDPEPAGNVSDKVMEQVWREERESR